MQQIKLSVKSRDILCVESKSPPGGVVVFGASGDLAQGKLFPGFWNIFARQLLDDGFYILGAGRKDFSVPQFRRYITKAIQSNASKTSPDITAFAEKIYYLTGAYDEPAFYERLGEKLQELDKKHGTQGRRIFYLAVPPMLYGTIAENLGTAGLASCGRADCTEHIRLVVEKPFGSDLQTASALDLLLLKWFRESQIYRIDHYLGKETVQNIMIFRFANTIFEPVWNRNYIDHVQITIAETNGIERRAGYYDKAGALRDMFQNHMLQMLALVAMEPPTSFDADRIRDEKAKLLRAVHPFSLRPWQNDIVCGQYGPGSIGGNKVLGYRQEQDVNPASNTETFVAARVFIDNWRWKGVPFYLRTGKRLAAKLTEVAIVFNRIPHSMFVSSGLEDMEPNVLVMRIQPAEGISLTFQAKRPGSKICISPLEMNFCYQDIFNVAMPEPYERLLLDCMVGDQTLFTRHDSIEIAWQLLTPVLNAWAGSESVPHEYPAGAQSFADADNLIESDGRKWRSISG